MLVIDCCTLSCPEPVIKCKKALSFEEVDEVQVLVDNEAALENVSRFLENNQYKLVTSQDQIKLWVIHGTKNKVEKQVQSENMNNDFIIKNDEITAVNESDNNYYESISTDKKNLVFISSKTLGQGDDYLGSKLMESFLLSLDEIPVWQIILVNGGVFLATEEGNALNHLKSLASKGVRVLVCGACLNHYQIYEQKKIGETTNMLDIITAFELADKIIKP